MEEKEEIKSNENKTEQQPPSSQNPNQQQIPDGKEVRSIDDMEFKEFGFFVVAGKRRCGKTKVVLNLLKNILSRYEVHQLLVFSETATFLEDYS